MSPQHQLQQEIILTTSPERQEELNLALNNKVDEINELEERLNQGVLSDSDVLNEDIIEIPLYRLLSQGYYNQVIDQAEEGFAKYVFSDQETIKNIEALGNV